ncbi:MAG: hypothetical protein FWF38_00770 [Spirochaetaceae bacterium]|nr:hypothetical protein [Spirochaetaceae bacterium]
MAAVENENKTETEKRIEKREDILCSIFGHSISIALVLFLTLGAFGKIGMTASVVVAFATSFALVILYLFAEKMYVK